MKYKLLAPQVLADGQLLEEGTEVGDDTAYPWKDADGKDMEPSTTMEGLDDASRAKVREVHQRNYGLNPPWERGQSEEARKAHEQQAEEQKKLDENSKPVSEQQRLERDWEKERSEGKRGEADMAPTLPPRGAPVVAPPGPARQPSSTATASPTRGGVTHPSPGPATAKPPDKNDVRPTKPNEEQYPKG
jgi:hypothetical protein